MAMRLKQPGASKLARPPGSGLKGTSTGMKKPTGAQSGMKQPTASPSTSKRLAGPVRQGQVPTNKSSPKQAPPSPQQPAASEAKDMELAIGDRVLVGGVKPGTIAFLGPTQFARGVWAGIVLDTKDGKNNGCVNGVQYFECEPNKGLFARPEKLELLAKSTATATPPSTGPSQEGATFSVGDHVAIEGGKQGEVAFCGTTEFSRGIWVGIILETPDGKNDGRVGEVQYFKCAPKHGLFTRPQKLTLIRRGNLAPSPRQQRSTSQEAESAPQGLAPNQSPVMDLKLLREKLKLGDRVLVGGAKEGFLRYLGPTEFAKGIWAGVELEDPLGKNDGAVSGKRYFQCPPRHGLFAPLPKVEKLADSGPPTDEASTSPGLRKASQQNHSRHLSSSSSGSLGAGKPPIGTTPPSSMQGTTAAGLSRILQEKEATITSLQTTLKDKEKEEKEMAETITNLSRQVEDLQFQLEEQGIISGDKLEGVEEDTQVRVTQLEEQLAREREDTNKLRQQLLQAQSGEVSGAGGSEELDSVRQASADLHSQLQEAHKRIEQLMGGLKESENREQHKTSALEAELTQAESAVSQLRNENTGIKQDLQDALELCNQHESLLEERNRELESSDVEIRSLKKERESLTNEQSRLITEQQKLASERDQAIMECDRLMTNNSDISTEQSELSRQRQSLLSERDQLIAERQAQRTEIEKVVSERDELQRSLQDLQQQRSDVMGQSREMGAKYDTIQEELSASQAEVERLKLELMSVTSKAEQDRLVMQEKMELAKAGGTELQDRIDKMTSERDSTLSRAQEMADKMVDLEKERDALQELLVKSSGEIDRLQDELDEVNKSHQLLEREVESESGALQQRLELAEGSLGEKERELAEARERIASLTDELVISQGKRDQAMLEEEKELLEERVRELTIQLEQAQHSKSAVSMAEELGEIGDDALASQLRESQSQVQSMQQSLQDYEQQVDFLNSVIADLQQKLEAAESLALMQPGEVASEDEEGVDQLPPPRLFCDICDEFDLHDTDDCPLQAASDSPPPSSYHEARAPGGSDRPYCNNCEVFGHWTDNCEYDVTY